MHGHGRGSFTHVRRELWPRVILGFRLMGISACMAREGSFTHVRRVLRPRVGISACMVTGGGVLLMLGASTGQGFFGVEFIWDICMHGQGREFYSC